MQFCWLRIYVFLLQTSVTLHQLLHSLCECPAGPCSGSLLGSRKGTSGQNSLCFSGLRKRQARFVGFNILVWETEETEEILHLKCIQHLQTGTQNRALYPSTMFAGWWVLNVNAHVHIPQFQTSPAASSPLRSPCLTPFLSPKLQYSVLPDSSCGPHPCISAGEFMCCFCLWSSQKLHWLPCPHSCSAHWGQNPTTHRPEFLYQAGTPPSPAVL